MMHRDPQKDDKSNELFQPGFIIASFSFTFPPFSFFHPTFIYKMAMSDG